MGIVSLELFKKHVRADDFAEDDEYLAHLLSAAELSVLKSVNRTFDEICDMGDGSFPPDLTHAVLLLGAHWYNQRESVAQVNMSAVPDTLQTLIKPYRKLVSDDCRPS